MVTNAVNLSGNMLASQAVAEGLAGFGHEGVLFGATFDYARFEAADTPTA